MEQTNKRNTFITRLQQIHGNDKYDYSELIYTTAKNKIKIIYKVHGCFEQRAQAHLMGAGCNQCSADKQKFTTQQFIEKSIQIHGINVYDYSDTNYVNYTNEIILKCLKCQDIFSQRPDSHLQGKGCVKCGIIKRTQKLTMSQDEFINKSQLIHGVDKYDYSKITYKNAKTKLTIKCLKCQGLFKQLPSAHLQGQGCPFCKHKTEQTLLQFLINTYKDHEIVFQKRFDWCKNPKTDRVLPCDIYFPHINIVIELQGNQHFEQVSNWSPPLMTQERDDIKKHTYQTMLDN